jgi:hypothetical protein
VPTGRDPVIELRDPPVVELRDPPVVELRDPALESTDQT